MLSNRLHKRVLYKKLYIYNKKIIGTTIYSYFSHPPKKRLLDNNLKNSLKFMSKKRFYYTFVIPSFLYFSFASSVSVPVFPPLAIS